VCWEYPEYRAAGISEDKVTALSGWLQAHAVAAALDSLAVAGDRREVLLQLPVQQLASLRSLNLERITVAVQGGFAAQTAPADLPPELSGITSLRLWFSNVGISTLPAFTKLQHLALCYSDSSVNAGECSLDLSGLLQLTLLHLSHDCATDAVLASLSSLPCLQELDLQGGFYTDSGLDVLPLSLTKLGVYGNVRVAPDSTPGVAQLTALQWLEVTQSHGVDIAVVRSMSSLQQLVVGWTLLPLPAWARGAEEEEGDPWLVDLAPLSGLTQLQSLHLPVVSESEPGYGAGTNAAALTASSQLTSLSIGALLQQQQYRHMFPEGRRLPKLKELWATMALLGTAKDAEALVKCCPNLEHLDVSKGVFAWSVMLC
jgi:hypothetical protein